MWGGLRDTPGMSSFLSLALVGTVRIRVYEAENTRIWKMVSMDVSQFLSTVDIKYISLKRKDS